MISSVVNMAVDWEDLLPVSATCFFFLEYFFLKKYVKFTISVKYCTSTLLNSFAEGETSMRRYWRGSERDQYWALFYSHPVRFYSNLKEIKFRGGGNCKDTCVFSFL